MLQVFQRHVGSVSNVCSKCFCSRPMLKCSDLDVAYVSHICCNNMFRMFQLFESYVAVSVFMLQVSSVLSGCCICFIHILQVYVSDVSSVHMYVALSVSCCTSFMMFEKSKGRGE
jgi:hypothetical protein